MENLRCYAADSHAPGDARRHVRARLGMWRLTRLCDDVELCVSEMITNAVTHGGSDEVALLLELTERAVLVRVWDGNPDPPRPRDAGSHDDAGRGLAIVTALSSRHGWYPVPCGGKVTWCEVALAGPARSGDGADEDERSAVTGLPPQ